MAGRPIRRARGGVKAELVSRPPFEPGNQLGRTHGAFAGHVDEEAMAVLPWLFDAELIERYPAMAALGAQCWVRRQRALADIERRGQVLVDGDGNVKAHPLLRYLGQWERTLLELSARFGLDPRSDFELRRAAADASQAAFDIEAAVSVGRAALEAREV